MADVNNPWWRIFRSSLASLRVSSMKCCGRRSRCATRRERTSSSRTRTPVPFSCCCTGICACMAHPGWPAGGRALRIAGGGVRSRHGHRADDLSWDGRGGGGQHRAGLAVGGLATLDRNGTRPSPSTLCRQLRPAPGSPHARGGNVYEQVERRIAHALLRLVQQSGRKVEAGVEIDFPISRQDVAEMTGATLYTVSRVLSAWEEKGLVAGGRQKITLRDPHRLFLLAEGGLRRE